MFFRNKRETQNNYRIFSISEFTETEVFLKKGGLYE